MPHSWRAVIGNELKITPNTISQGIKRGFTPEDISLCTKKREEYTGYSEINTRVVVLHIQLILTLCGIAATLKDSLPLKRARNNRSDKK